MNVWIQHAACGRSSTRTQPQNISQSLRWDILRLDSRDMALRSACRGQRSHKVHMLMTVTLCAAALQKCIILWGLVCKYYIFLFRYGDTCTKRLTAPQVSQASLRNVKKVGVDIKYFSARCGYQIPRAYNYLPWKTRRLGSQAFVTIMEN